MNQVKINGIAVGANCPPYFVAELSGNHNRSLDRALELVRLASKSGAQAVKLQTYTADTMTVDSDREEYVINDKNSPWYKRRLYNLYEEAHTPWEWHEPIFNECKKLGITCFSSPFDRSAVDFLEKLDAPAFKIASFENNYDDLLEYTLAKGKPVIVSTGMANLALIENILKIAREVGNSDLLLLKCTSSYPAPPTEINLNTIPHLSQLAGVNVGLSDHTLGSGVAVASIALGACFIEKHFTKKRADGGVDASFSMEPEEFEDMVRQGTLAWQALGKINYKPTNKEINSQKFRRSLIAIKDIKKGDRLNASNFAVLRPAIGLGPEYQKVFAKRTAKQTILKGDPLTWENTY